MVGALSGDYMALVGKRNFAALSTIKSSRALAEKLLAQDPSYYDAYLAVGVENYLLGVNPAPIRWLLPLGGTQTDKNEGIAKLHLTAEKGHYRGPTRASCSPSLPFATVTAPERAASSLASPTNSRGIRYTAKSWRGSCLSRYALGPLARCMSSQLAVRSCTTPMRRQTALQY
jgi:hypothetical protein